MNIFLRKQKRVTVKREVTPDGVIAQLQISSAEAPDSGAYFCQASNLYGRDQQLVQLLVQGTINPSMRKFTWKRTEVQE